MRKDEPGKEVSHARHAGIMTEMVAGTHVRAVSGINFSATGMRPK